MRALGLLSTPVLTLVFFASISVAVGAEYPPTTRLRDQVLVAERPDRASLSETTATSGITRGYEAIYFSVELREASRRVVYDTAQKKITRVDADPARSHAQPVGLSDNWAGIDRWRRHFERAEREDLLAMEHLEDGFGCRAQVGRGPGTPVVIHLDRPALDTTTRLCALQPYEDRPLYQFYWLRMMPSGDVAVLAGDGKVAVLQIYENPMLDAIGAQWNALMNYAYRGEPKVRAQYVGSLYDLSEYADRAFDPYLLASDGRVYFGTMPHHSSESGPVFAFDPKPNKLVLLGDVARMAGVHQAGAAPHMMHSSMFEMNGKIYFTGQDCHYANWNFPVQREQDRARYLGSPIVEFDPQTRQARGLGIPLPGDHALFGINGDGQRNALYVRRGYSRRHYGPLIWHRLALDEQGNLSGKPRAFPFPEEQHPEEILIGPNGTVFGVVPDLKLQETFQQKRRARESTDHITPTCYVYRVDPELREAKRIATITGTWDVRWAPWQHGKPSAVGIGDECFYQIDLRTGAVRQTVKRPQIPAIELGPFVLHDGKMYLMPRVEAKDRIAGRTMALYSVDLRSGQTLYYGLIVDNQGRRPKDLNRFTFLPDGRIFATGTVYGLPTDRNYMPRYRDSEPYRLDCAALVIDNLPPGRPFEPEANSGVR
ncbi:MAG: Kelch repeat-containing protein [Planctomycetota bacterium]|jgi:hypothetical protein